MRPARVSCARGTRACGRACASWAGRCASRGCSSRSGRTAAAAAADGPRRVVGASEDTTARAVAQALCTALCTPVHRPSAHRPGSFSRDLHGPSDRASGSPLAGLRPLLCLPPPGPSGGPSHHRSRPTSRPEEAAPALPCPTTELPHAWRRIQHGAAARGRRLHVAHLAGAARASLARGRRARRRGARRDPPVGRRALLARAARVHRGRARARASGSSSSRPARAPADRRRRRRRRAR